MDNRKFFGAAETRKKSKTEAVNDPQGDVETNKKQENEYCVDTEKSENESEMEASASVDHAASETHSPVKKKSKDAKIQQFQDNWLSIYPGSNVHQHIYSIV
jgi:hypothetical protein